MRFPLITENWGLKILALVLAIVIYHALKTETTRTQTPDDRHIFDRR